MFEVFEKEKIIVVLMFACLLISILVRLVLAFVYQEMIQETENMSTTNHKMLKQCKTKFLGCCKMNNGMQNIPVFVDKFLNRLALWRLPLDTVYHLSGQFMLLSVVFSGIGTCKQLAKGSVLGEVIPFYLFCMIGIYLYFTVSSVLDVQGKKNNLKINLIDYLENHMSSRMQGVEEEIRNFEGAKPAGRKSVELIPLGERRPEIVHFSNESSAELEALLKEFLTFS